MEGASLMVKVSVIQTGFHIDPVHWDMNLPCLVPTPRSLRPAVLRLILEWRRLQYTWKVRLMAHPAQNFSNHPGLVLFLICLQEPGKWDLLRDQGPDVFPSAFLAAAVSMASSP